MMDHARPASFGDLEPAKEADTLRAAIRDMAALLDQAARGELIPAVAAYAAEQARALVNGAVAVAGEPEDADAEIRRRLSPTRRVAAQGLYGSDLRAMRDGWED